MAKVKVVKELPRSATNAERCLVKKGKKYFVVSSVDAMFSGFETLVFPSNCPFTCLTEIADCVEHIARKGQRV